MISADATQNFTWRLMILALFAVVFNSMAEHGTIPESAGGAITFLLTTMVAFAVVEFCQQNARETESLRKAYGYVGAILAVFLTLRAGMQAAVITMPTAVTLGVALACLSLLEAYRPEFNQFVEERLAARGGVG